ncbi:MAG: PilZ domain-containing protein [Gammaproteobacteria bacterium]|nr:PilZ domain-containing protein [Gammaproteobacteria bacterium]
MSGTSFQYQLERRRSKRNIAIIRVFLAGGPWRHQGVTRDISRRGAFVMTDYPGLCSGTRFDLLFVQSMSNVVKIRRYTVEVTRQAFGGVGIIFCASPRLERVSSHPDYGRLRHPT